MMQHIAIAFKEFKSFVMTLEMEMLFQEVIISGLGAFLHAMKLHSSSVVFSNSSTEFC